MPNKHYVKGRKHEYKILNEAKKQGYLAIRSAGSHSPIDVIIIDTSTSTIKLIQCKTGAYSETEKTRVMNEFSYLSGIYDVEFEVR